MKNCLACQLNNNPSLVPGGRIAESKHWIVEHCVGSFGIGAVVIKTKKHKEQFSECSEAEAGEFGRLLRIVSQAIEGTTKPEQIYVAKWGEETKHLHVLIQPVTTGAKRKLQAKGPRLQVRMIEKGEKPIWKKAETVAFKLRHWIQLH